MSVSPHNARMIDNNNVQFYLNRAVGSLTRTVTLWLDAASTDPSPGGGIGIPGSSTAGAAYSGTPFGRTFDLVGTVQINIGT